MHLLDQLKHMDLSEEIVRLIRKEFLFLSTVHLELGRPSSSLRHCFLSRHFILKTFTSSSGKSGKSPPPHFCTPSSLPNLWFFFLEIGSEISAPIADERTAPRGEGEISSQIPLPLLLSLFFLPLSSAASRQCVSQRSGDYSREWQARRLIPYPLWITDQPFLNDILNTCCRLRVFTGSYFIVIILVPYFC